MPPPPGSLPPPGSPPPAGPCEVGYTPLPSPYQTNRISERDGSGSISFTKNGTVAKRIFAVPYYDRTTGKYFSDFVQTLLGGGDDGLGGVTKPDSFGSGYVDAAGRPFLYCQEVEVQGDTQDGYDSDNPPRVVYKNAIITATYAPRYHKTFSINGSVLTLPAKDDNAEPLWLFTGENEDDGVPTTEEAVKQDALDESLGKIVPLGEYSFQNHFIFLPDFPLLYSLIGTVNSDVLVEFFETETMLFTGFDTKVIQMPNGADVGDFTFKWLFNPRKHNKLYRAKPLSGGRPAGYYYVKTKAAPNDTIYKKEAHTPIMDMQ